MPLPDRSVPWPPKDTEEPRAHYDVWGAWYGGSAEELSRVYGGSMGPTSSLDLKTHPWQYSGGLRGLVGRTFWGAPPSDGQQPARLHVPIASDIAAVNADLLYAEPPTLTVDHAATQGRLDALFRDGMHTALLEGAELCSPYGGVYQRVSWDTNIADHPFLEPIPPDSAAPEWAGQYLSAVTFWRVLSDEDGHVWRHLERHEPGRVFHGLYQGTSDRLGRPMPLEDRPATERFAPLVDADGGIATGASGLAVEYVPNMRPNRLMRGSPLGRSDYQGVEPLMDALDETYSSWMRDVRLAKARLIVPDSFLDTHGRGHAATFDPEREIFKGVGALQGQGERFSDMITQVQFNIRVEEHSRTAQGLAEQIVRGAGFSAQTFGEGPNDVAVTATEVQHRQHRTYATRDRKAGYQTGSLMRLSRTMLEVDAHVFSTRGINPRASVTVVWPDGVQDAPEATARTVQMLDAARAASTEVKVRIVHPDWDDEQVAEEVRQLKAENPPVDFRAAAGLVNGQDEEEPEDDEGVADKKPATPKDESA